MSRIDINKHTIMCEESINSYGLKYIMKILQE